MAFDIPFDQQLDAMSHGYINSTLENPHGHSLKICILYWLFNASFGVYHYMGLVRSLGICLNINGTIDEISMKENKQLSTTGAWGMDFVSSSPLVSTTPPPFFQNFHIHHSFFKIFIIIRFSSFDNISRRHISWIIRVFCVHSFSTDTV